MYHVRKLACMDRYHSYHNPVWLADVPLMADQTLAVQNPRSARHGSAHALVGCDYLSRREGLAVMYIAPAPVPDLTVAGTPEQIARGEYLVNVACLDCHGANDGEKMPLTGGLDMMAGEGEEDFSFAGSMVTANLTPGGVLADRTDGELFRVIRYGFGKDALLGMMSSLPYRELSDDDTHAIIAFLRSQEPVTTATNGGDNINLIAVILFYSEVLFPLDEDIEGVITAPPQGVTAEYGKYVATFGECRGCHGTDMTGTAATVVSPAIPNPRVFVGAITLEQFIQTMRTGVRPNGRHSPTSCRGKMLPG